MASRYLVQILDTQTGELVQFEPGRAVEGDLVADVTTALVKKLNARNKEIPFGAFIDTAIEAIKSRGVGFTKTEFHVTQDIRDGLQDVLLRGHLVQTPTDIGEEVRASIVEALNAVKAKVKA